MNLSRKQKILASIVSLTTVLVVGITAYIILENKKLEEAIVKNIKTYENELEELEKEKEEYLINIKGYLDSLDIELESTEEEVTEEEVTEEQEEKEEYLLESKNEAIDFLNIYNLELEEFSENILVRSVEANIPDERMENITTQILSIQENNTLMCESLIEIVRSEYIEYCDEILTEADKESKTKLKASNEAIVKLLGDIEEVGLENHLTEDEIIDIKEQAEKLKTTQEKLIEEIEAEEKAAAEAAAKKASSSSSSSSSSNSSSSSSSSSGETLGKGSWTMNYYTVNGETVEHYWYSDGSVKKVHVSSGKTQWWTASQWASSGFN